MYRREMVKTETVKAIAAHLSSAKSDVRQAVLKALVSFTERCTPACAQQVCINLKFNIYCLMCSMKLPYYVIDQYNLQEICCYVLMMSS